MITAIIDKKTKEFIREDVDFNHETELLIEVEPTQGLFKPKWSGEITVVEGAIREDEEGNITVGEDTILVGEGEWVEGATQEEIDELTKPQPQEPTVEERLAQTEELLQTVTMAFTEYVFTQEMSDDS